MAAVIFKIIEYDRRGYQTKKSFYESTETFNRNWKKKVHFIKKLHENNPRPLLVARLRAFEFKLTDWIELHQYPTSQELDI